MSSQPSALHERAADNLRYIRDAMERAGSFTAVPGWGGVGMGVSALIAAYVARGFVLGSDAWLRVWLIEVAVAVAIGATTIGLKAKRTGTPVFTGAGRKFALTQAPALLVGGMLTIALRRWGQAESLPAVWMLLYGAGVATGGAFSVKVVPMTGALFMAAGSIALFLPVGWGNWLMAATFGAFHIIFGLVIARHYGG